MAEMQPPEPQINGESAAVVVAVASSENIISKRQRRPSVRLGDIGDQSYDSHMRRSKQWKLTSIDNDSKFHHRYHQRDSGNKSSKTRPLMNFHETLETEDKGIGEGNLDSVAIGSWRVKDSKSKRGLGPGSLPSATKRVRSNWVPKIDEVVDGDGKFSAAEDVDDGFNRDFDPEGSESPLKEQSPVHSMENMAVDVERDRDLGFHGQRRNTRVRVSEGREHDAVELDGPVDGDVRDWKCGTSVDRNGSSGGRGRCRSPEDGVRIWLNGLGLGRYAPVFEIHEVDDEVLPLLTLEDLKDMGISAVGSRRKMYSAIQKLGKGFS